MSGNALYTDLSGYYDLMCADIDYRAQSLCVQRLHTLFGNGGMTHLDLACGTGPHIRHFLDSGYRSTGLDINLPMLERAASRCPDAVFNVGDMCAFSTEIRYDLITCFLYSLHYSGDLSRLCACIERTHEALADGGVFCFNAVDKNAIDSARYVSHSAVHPEGRFTFSSGWNYPGHGDRQWLKLRIEKHSANEHQRWSDEHAMVAVSFSHLQQLLEPYFDVQVLEHDYQKIAAWDETSGNALFVCVKR